MNPEVNPLSPEVEMIPEAARCGPGWPMPPNPDSICQKRMVPGVRTGSDGARWRESGPGFKLISHSSHIQTWVQISAWPLPAEWFWTLRPLCPDLLITLRPRDVERVMETVNVKVFHSL